MTLLAPDAAGVLHRASDHPAQLQPADDRRLPRHVPAAAPLRAPADRQAAVPAGHRRSRRAADRRVPQPSRTGPGQQPPTRNARLGAIHSFYRFAALEHPEHAATIARVMAIPTKRHERNTVSYLDLDEIKALLAAPDRSTWLGRRDHALLRAHDPDRRARLRARRPAHRRRAPRHRRPHPGDRQGKEEARHDPDRRDRRDPARVAERAPRPARGARCSRPARDGRSAATQSGCWSQSTPPRQPRAARR